MNMTNEEAIKYLIKPVATSTEIGEEKQKEFEAYNMAIEALNDAEYINLLQEHIDYQDEIIRKAVAKLKIDCTGCVHYDQQQTAMICRDCKRYHKDMYKEL